MIEKITNTADFEYAFNVADTEFDVLSLAYPIEWDGSETLKPFHMHDYYEFVYVVKGKVSFQIYCDGALRSTELYQGNYMLVLPENKHRFIGVEQTECYKIGFVMRQTKNSGSGYNYFAQSLKNQSGKILRNENLSAYITQFMRVSNNSVLDGERKRAAFTLLLFAICENSSENYSLNEENRSKNLLKNGHNVKDIISNALMYGYAADISVHDVAESTFLCVRQVDRICKTMYGRSFLGQKTYLRIENAKSLLDSTDKSITYVAMQCGYNSIANFYRAFKKETGLSAAEYRNRDGNRNDEN